MREKERRREKERIGTGSFVRRELGETKGKEESCSDRKVRLK